MGRANCSVPLLLVLLAFLSCFFLAHGLYGLTELFGSPDLSPEAILLIFALSFLVLAAAVAGASGNRKMFLPREGAAAAAGSNDGGQAMLTTAEEVAVGGEMHLLLSDDEEMLARRVDLQTQDYPGSGANGRHDPRNPH
ncbi:unnamed protein product [Triticum turgidum subsp. durum]|uniref:Uncharacterized protein n=2 Tax=Triticum TaxID=4564 RepID=A0A9R1QGG6_TRITD|nr:unnamed protein product [Triticum aestivum]VAH76157.1 unnamed protein product [Triticum turgidum subsp. durum]